VTPPLTASQRAALHQAFGGRVQENAPLAPLTSARLGGAADYLLPVRSADELAETVTRLWALEIPFVLLGGGSNVLVSDDGVREVVVLNRAKQIRFEMQDEPPAVWAESGANFGLVARQAAQRGLSGLEWAAGIPGTVGGAVYGNAGAHGGEVAAQLQMAEILHKVQGGAQRSTWTAEHFQFGYRTSALKHSAAAVVLSARFALRPDAPENIRARMDEFLAHRRRTQPRGASLGSIFKNPPGDYAGRLIEAAGLKGTRIGGAEISRQHANFFINDAGAAASDVMALIQLARRTVAEQFGIELALEIEVIGDWELETDK
jgi:UDP-N-acetylmuramate dehydrogenase